MSLTTANGTIVITDAVNGEFDLVVPSGTTEALKPIVGVYDIKLINGAAEVEYFGTDIFEIEERVTI